MPSHAASSSPFVAPLAALNPDEVELSIGLLEEVLREAGMEDAAGAADAAEVARVADDERVMGAVTGAAAPPAGASHLAPPPQGLRSSSPSLTPPHTPQHPLTTP